ncbi:hypothetical protein EVG20_g629 [Dentipellis fragilis]|uniref:F-box domain-containing protein n=1 Tax=Dentipellis fragilis TaxID=205917 RepID=A0A4Y9ZEH1_9AGAM|nr:hypothetical protein EVG20_g629 [Dentipellis fragilis]
MSISNPAVSASEYWRSAEEQRFAHLPKSPNRSWAKHSADVKKTLDLEMDAVSMVMCSLRTRFNAIAHVNRLPPEVLVHVFSLLQEEDPPRIIAEYGKPTRVFFGWIEVTYICRQWRSTALGHASLWSNIPFSIGPQWTEESLRRSQAAPIFLAYSSNREKEMDIGAMLEHHLSHVRNLWIDWKREGPYGIFPSLCDAAPVLETAELTNLQTLSDHTPVPSLPEDLFAHTAPRLRYLRTYRFGIQWSSLTFRSITELHIICWSNDSDRPILSAGQQNIRDVVAALARMPALEVLWLDRALPPLATAPSPSPSQATHLNLPVVPAGLPKLRTLRLVDGVAECAAMLKHIATPPTTEPSITCVLDVANGHSAELILPWLAACAATASTRALSVLDLSIGFEMTMWDSASPDDPLMTWMTRRYAFKMTLMGLPGDATRIAQLAVFAGVLPLADLELIVVEYESAFSALEWLEGFGRCAKVCEVVVKKAAAASLCEALMLGNPAGGPLFPALKHLTLQDIDIENSGLGETLLKWLRIRQNITIPVQRINIKDCHVRRATIERIKEEVPEVCWDDEGDGEEEEDEDLGVP